MRRERRRSARYYSVIMLVFFIACIVMTGMVIYESIQQTRLAFSGVKTDATVVQIKRNGRGRTTTLRFTSEAGMVFNVKDVSGQKGREIGDIVPVVYLPSNPEIVSAQGFRGFTVLITNLILIVVLCLVFVSAWWKYEEAKMYQHPSYIPSPGSRV